MTAWICLMKEGKKRFPKKDRYFKYFIKNWWLQPAPLACRGSVFKGIKEGIQRGLHVHFFI